MSELRSRCCGAEVITDEDWIDAKEVIVWYRCSKCKKYCDSTEPEEKKDKDCPDV